MGPGDDQVNMKLEGNGHWESWTRTHLLAVCTWTCSSCSQEKNVFLFKAPEKTNSLPTANAVKQLSGVYRNDETSSFFFSPFHFLCGRIPYRQRHSKIVYLWRSWVHRVSASVNITRHFKLFWAVTRKQTDLQTLPKETATTAAYSKAQSWRFSHLCPTLSFILQVWWQARESKHVAA